MSTLTITRNGGASQYCRSKTSEMRAVLCKNGIILIRVNSKTRWSRPHYPWSLTVAMLNADPYWEIDTRSAVSAARTRTTRRARREGM